MQEFKLPKVFNWQTASDKLVKKYVADLYQSGTDAPVETDLFNNTGISFTYEYYGVGVYAVTSSKPIFSGCGMGCPSGQKNQVTVSNQLVVFGVNTAAIGAFPVADNLIIILAADKSGAVDDILGHFLQNTLEITFYPNH